MHTHNIDGNRPWFRAKRYGWGWGLPLTWQGWLVLGTYITLTVFGALLFAHTHNMALLAGFVVLTLLLVVICWLTGERPRWRWGGKD